MKSLCCCVGLGSGGFVVVGLVGGGLVDCVVWFLVCVFGGFLMSWGVLL